MLSKHQIISCWEGYQPQDSNGSWSYILISHWSIAYFQWQMPSIHSMKNLIIYIPKQTRRKIKRKNKGPLAQQLNPIDVCELCPLEQSPCGPAQTPFGTSPNQSRHSRGSINSRLHFWNYSLPVLAFHDTWIQVKVYCGKRLLEQKSRPTHSVWLERDLQANCPYPSSYSLVSLVPFYTMHKHDCLHPCQCGWWTPYTEKGI